MLRWILCVLSLVLVSSSLARADERLEGIACRSVHLSYQTVPGTAFYNEITVDKSAPGTYFCVCGWDKGYFGIQELARGNKLFIFSVWDSQQNDPKAVEEDKRVKLLHKDDKTRIGRFGGEGTGGQSFYDYDWKIGQTLRLMVTAKANGNRTEYGGYFFHPEEKVWKHMVTFSTITGGLDRLRGQYSFVEDFKRDRVSATKAREAHYGNGWMKTAADKWEPILKAKFTADRNPVLNINSGTGAEKFFLVTGGETTNTGTKLNALMDLPAGTERKAPSDLPAEPKAAETPPAR